MNRRKFLGANTVGAAGSVFLGHKAFAETKQMDTIRESSKNINVQDTADIIVLGGGPAGCSAAIAAGRLGLDVLLVERYGYLGGMATGGLVIGYFEYDKGMRGIVSEINDRIITDGGRYVETNRVSKHEPFFNPEMFKIMCLDMVEKANVRLLFHAWGVGAVVKNDKIEAVIIESKSGRQALRAKMIIDCTGDADTAAWAGVPHENTTESNGLALDFIYRNVDFDKYRHFITYFPDEWKKMKEKLNKDNISWGAWYIGWNDLAWFNTFYKGNPTNVNDLTNCEIDLRHRIVKHWEFYKKNVPGFEVATISKTASQIGCRVSRRITGEHVLTMDDLKAGKFDDTIGKICPLKAGNLLDVPYRSLVPKKINNVLYAGRCISGTVDVIQRIRGMSGCSVFGQGAGVAAALSLKEGVSPRKLDIGKLQASLRNQGVDI